MPVPEPVALSVTFAIMLANPHPVVPRSAICQFPVKSDLTTDPVAKLSELIATSVTTKIMDNFANRRVRWLLFILLRASLSYLIGVTPSESLLHALGIDPEGTNTTSWDQPRLPVARDRHKLRNATRRAQQLSKLSPEPDFYFSLLSANHTRIGSPRFKIFSNCPAEHLAVEINGWQRNSKVGRIDQTMNAIPQLSRRQAPASILFPNQEF